MPYPLADHADNDLTRAQRRREVARLLAAGLVRLRRSSQPFLGPPAPPPRINLMGAARHGHTGTRG